jgi:trehalose 6-phosphate phosphatase
MQDTQAPVLADFLGRLGTAPSSILLLDYDGTLAPFQTRRDQAYPYPGVVCILESIMQCGKTRVIVITGRPVSEVQALLSPLSNFEIWGAHGLEHLLADGTYRQAAIASDVSKGLAEAEQWLKTSGLSSRSEVKPGGVAVHWRGLSDAEIEKVRASTRKGWGALAKHPGLKLLDFEGGLELRAAHPDKGDAIAEILRDLDPNVQIAFLGDDLTDEDGFRVLGDRGLSVLVRSEYRETNAKAWLRPPDELVAFFEQWMHCTSYPAPIR